MLPWGWIDNRPFLRCMHGFGLSLWRLGRFEEAGSIFDRMLWLNPSDNQGVRFLIDKVGAQGRLGSRHVDGGRDRAGQFRSSGRVPVAARVERLPACGHGGRRSRSPLWRSA